MVQKYLVPFELNVVVCVICAVVCVILVHFPESPVVVVPLGSVALLVHPYATSPLSVSCDFPVSVTFPFVHVVGLPVKLIVGTVVSLIVTVLPYAPLVVALLPIVSPFYIEDIVYVFAVQFAISVILPAPIVRLVSLIDAPVPDTVQPLNVYPVLIGLSIVTVLPYVPLVGAFVPFVPPFNVYDIVYVFTVQFAVSVILPAPIVRLVPLIDAPVPDTVHPANV